MTLCGLAGRCRVIVQDGGPVEGVVRLEEAEQYEVP